MIAGNKLIAQFGKESKFPTAADYTIPSFTNQIRLISEGMNDTYNKTDEGVLTGGKGKAKSVVTSNIVDGSVDFLARPDDIGFFLKMALGNETKSEAGTKTKHTFTAAAESLPNFAILLNKVVNTYVYEGCKIASLEFNAAPEDYLKVTASVQGYKCEGGKQAKQEDLIPSALNAFMFSGATVKFNDVKLADVTSIRWSYNNNLQSETTTDTGIHRTEATPATREITSDISCIFTAASDAFDTAYYKQDASVSLEIKFESGDNSLTIKIPANTVTACSAPFDGADGRHQNMTVEAYEDGENELITIELVNDINTVY